MESSSKSKFPPKKKLKSSKANLEDSEEMVQKYPTIKPRGFYSEILAAGASTVLGNVQEGPEVSRHYLNQSGQQYYTPQVFSFDGPDDLLTHLESQIYGSSTELQARSDFTLRSFQPKVQVPFHVAPGQRPRKLEIERRRRLYQSYNLKQLLKIEGINSDKLMPRHSGPERYRAKTGKNPPQFTAYLPLEVFDDEEFECRTPEEWLQLGYEERSNVRKPIPGKALLPKDDKLGHGKEQQK